MHKLSNNELLEINGGGINWSVVFGLVSGISFFSGFFKSFFRRTCR